MRLLLVWHKVCGSYICKYKGMQISAGWLVYTLKCRATAGQLAVLRSMQFVFVGQKLQGLWLFFTVSYWSIDTYICSKNVKKNLIGNLSFVARKLGQRMCLVRIRKQNKYQGRHHDVNCSWMLLNYCGNLEHSSQLCGQKAKTTSRRIVIQK